MKYGVVFEKIESYVNKCSFFCTTSNTSSKSYFGYPNIFKIHLTLIILDQGTIVKAYNAFDQPVLILLQAIGGFILIFAESGVILYVSESVSPLLGYASVSF